VSYLTVQNSSVAGNALNFATHHLYVAKHKDAETYASGAFNSLNSANPQVDFNKFFDGENIVQEDMSVSSVPDMQLSN
jgi:primary-amine oxidase